MSCAKGAKGPGRRGPEELPIMADQMEQKIEEKMDTVGLMDCRIANILTNIISRSLQGTYLCPYMSALGNSPN